MNAALVVTVLALAALLAAEYRGERLGVWLAKPVASGGFVALALTRGAVGTGYGRAVLIALGLAWVGDVALIPESPRALKLGLGAFLLGHLGFVAGFALRGASLGWSALALAALCVPALAVGRWLLPRVPDTLRVPVAAYIAVISTMVAFAVGTVALHSRGLILGGALAFYLSDLSVARDRFVAPGFGNKAWGLPLYYGAQVALAWTVA